MCLMNIQKKDEKAREGRPQPPDTGQLSGGREHLFGVPSEVKIVAVAAASDSTFQLQVRWTFLLGLSKAHPLRKAAVSSHPGGRSQGWRRR